LERTHLIYYLFGILLFFSITIQSQTLVIEKEQQNYTLDNYLAIAIDKTNALSFNSQNTIDSLLDFKPLAAWSAETFQPEQIYWSKPISG